MLPSDESTLYASESSHGSTCSAGAAVTSQSFPLQILPGPISLAIISGLGRGNLPPLI